MSNQHVLKIHPAPLADLLSGAKTAEVRRNDRGFQVGDTVRLMEVNPETGNWTGGADHVRTITHIQKGYGLPDDMCVLSYGKVGHDYKAHWMGFMDRTDWMQEKGQVPAKYLGQHRADILTDMLREAREALARVEAEHEANRLELGEALILIGQVLDCRTLEDLNPVRRYLNEFVDRYSLLPVPDVDLAQAEQQEAKPATFADAIMNPPRLPPRLKEAQGAQAGEFQREDRYIVIKRKDLVALHQEAYGPTQVAIEAFYAAIRMIEVQLPRRDYLVIESDWPEYEPTWAAIQARVEGRAAQPAVPDEVDQFFEQAKAELRRARAKFPGDRIMTLALAEEFGELCKAVLDESAEAVRKEAVQVACMAARVVLDGDGSVVDWRRERGLDPLLGSVRGAEHA